MPLQEFCDVILCPVVTLVSKGTAYGITVPDVACE